MKGISKRIVLWLTALVCALVAVFGFVSLDFKSKDNVLTVYAEQTTVDGDWYKFNYSSTSMEFLLSGNLKDYKALDISDFSSLKNDVVEAVKNLFIENILNKTNDNGNDGGASSFSATSATSPKAKSFALKSFATQEVVPPIDIPDVNIPEDFDWANADLGKLKDYVVDRLSDHNEFQNYVNGSYDILIDYAIDTYVNKQVTEEEKEQAYDKIQGALKDVVTEAYDKAVVNAQEELKENFVPEDWEEIKVQAEVKVEERVETVQQNGGKVTITVEQVIAAINSISVDGRVLYTPANPQIDTVRYILSKLPKPSVIANMTAEQMRNFLPLEVSIGTTFGDVTFDFNLGFFGDTSTIQKTVGKLAEYFELSLNGNDLSLNINVPAKFADVLAKFYQSSRFTQENKDLVFDFFSKKVSEIPDYSLTELTNFVKSIDFKAFLNNLIDATYLNNYFGSYINSYLGRPLTNDDIKTLINKVADLFVPRMETISSMSVEEVKDWINAKVPGVDGILNNEKVTAMAEKLLEVANKIDWSKFEYDYINELLGDPNSQINERIYSYIDRLENFESYYDLFTGYLDKIITRLPSSLQNASLASLYNGEKFTGSATVDVDNILTRISSALSSRGFDNIADYVDKLGLVLDADTSVGLNLSVNVPNLYQITYEVNGTPVKTGFLPTSVNAQTISSFAGVDTVGELNVLYWVDKNTQQKVEQMPASNIVLVPFLDFKVAITPTEPISAVYDADTSYDITATVIGDANAQNVYEYTWYKDTVVISNTTNVLTVNDVADSGEYYVVVSLVGTNVAVESEKVSVSITAKELDLTGAVWTPTQNTAVYDGTEKTVALDLSGTALTPVEKEYVQSVISYTVNNQPTSSLSFTNAGVYTIRAKFAGGNSNYTVKGVDDYTFTITKKAIDVDVSWGDDQAITYDGTEKSLEINVSVTSGGQNVADSVYTVVKTNDKATNAGTYEATVKITIIDSNYKFSSGNGEYSKDWVIDAKTINIAGATWVAPSDAVYNGEPYAVSLNLDNATGLLPDEKNVIIYNVLGKGDTNTLSFTDAGIYRISAKSNSENYIVAGIPDFEFQITPKIISRDAVTVEWNYQGPIEKTGETITITANVTIDGFTSDDFTVAYTGNEKIATGIYTAIATITMKSSNYDFNANDNVFELNWRIVEYWGVGHEFETPIGITVQDVHGKVIKDLNIAVSKETLDQKVYQDKLDELFPNNDSSILFSYNIHFKDASATKHPVSGLFKVSIPIPEEYHEYEESRLAVIHIADNGEITIIENFNRVGNNMEFETDGFSIFSVILLEETSSNALLIILIVIAALLLAILIVLIILLIKRKKGGKDDGQKPSPEQESSITVEENNEQEQTEETVDVEEVQEVDDTQETQDVQEPQEQESPEEPQAPVQAVAPFVLPTDGSAMIVRSFSARLAQSKDELKKRYSELKNYILSYKKVRSKLSWNYDAFYSGRKPVCKILIKGKTLTMFVALDPDTLAAKYYHDSVKDIAKYEKTPTKLKIRSDRALKYAKELVAMVMEEYGVMQLEIPEADYVVNNASDNELFLMGLIKIKKIKGNPWAKSQNDNAQTPEEEIDEDAEVINRVIIPDDIPADGSATLVRSFASRVSQASEELKQRYSELKNFILSYKKVRSKLSWNYDAFYSGRKPVCKVLIKGKTLTMYVALDPDTLAPKYHADSVKGIAKYEKTPTKLKIRSDRALKYAKDLVAMVMEEYGVMQLERNSVDYVADVISDDELLLMGMIKVKKAKSSNPWAKTETIITEEAATTEINPQEDNANSESVEKDTNE